MKKIFFLLTLILSYVNCVAQQTWSERMAATVLTTHPDSIAYAREGKNAHWDYEQGLVLKALEQIWYRTGDARYFRYIRKIMDTFINDTGDIRTYQSAEYNLDNITPGRVLLMLYQETGQEKYKLAAQLLRKQLQTHPRTKQGGFWHKKKYPNQMWLDGLYMAQPFYAEYSQLFNEPQNVADIINQFVWMEKNSRDVKTGLLYHGWDESREQKWAHPQTGRSPGFWSRAMGWYAMALVDVLDYIPQKHPRRHELVAILNRLMPAIVKYQDPESGCWYQVTDQPKGKNNYIEASGSSMFVYALAKGVRHGYLPAALLVPAQKGYQGILKNFITTDGQGLIHLEKTVSVSGLGGTPYRDGSYEYYVSEPIRKDDLKGIAPFLMASVEMEILPELSVGRGKTVALDYYFNREYRKNNLGQPERFHYTWEDPKDSGYSLWGTIFREFGARIDSVPTAPTPAALKKVQVYIIVDPDTKKETAAPNFIQAAHIKVIQEWVAAGGTLVLLANDTANTELKHFNLLARVFGIQFTDKNINFVKNDQFEQGKFEIPANHQIFKSVRKIFVKELTTLSVKAPAKPVLKAGDDIVMAVSTYGKGKVFALGDPWIYNEYLNGKRLPPEYENYQAAKDLSRFLLKNQ